jgi:tripartite-type tricarboxylate transporter receptor subunit TctC
MHRTTRRALLAAGLALPALPARAAWPERPINAIIPFAPGGGTDGVARILAEALARALGQPVLIDNRGGANGAIGATAAARARPDGYNFFFTTGTTQAINPALYRSLTYDPVRDFLPVGMVGIFPLMLLVHPSVPAQDIAALLALARAKPGTLTFGHWSAVYLAAGKMLARGAGAEILDVPYRSSANTMTDLVAGRISMAVVDLTVGLPLARSGEVRALAVTGARRSALLPDLPTLQEAGLAGYDISAWMGVFAPTGTPPEATSRLGAALRQVLGDPALVARFAGLGFETTPGDAAALAAFADAERARWKEIVAAANITVE